MDILEKYAIEHELTKENVLRLVDEYTLYCHYLDYCPELATRYTSPIRPDDKRPSFTLFNSNNKYYQYLWKDHGYNDSGSIFKLIKILYGLNNINEVLVLIDNDFELGLSTGKPIENKITRYDTPEAREEIIIRVKTRSWNLEDKEYWESQGLTVSFVKEFNVFPVQYFWTKNSQIVPISPIGICYAYAIGNYFKIYQPYNSEFKFISNYPSNYIEGFIQLKYSSSTLIITKSLKEVMWFKANLGIDAVAGKSESTMIPEQYITLFKKKYNNIIVFLDPDPAGYKQAYKYQELYGFKWYTILPCYFTNAKDPTDHTKKYNVNSTIQLISQIINEVDIL
jgi:hypothetical protein